MTSSTESTGPWRMRELLKPELALVVLMACVIGMLIIPLPTPLVDLIIGLNMAVAIVIFLSSFYVERILDFSTFPSILLFTTIMRLALSVSTSRLILVDADAGHIVQAFGEFVVADNLVVGFVVFAIVTIVQFVVITKGSERVGEVVARFSLDGMPGKQMSIDADLRAQSITAEEAQARRKDVERESQLYGSYDGAMKFVKGDAIAGIVILLVNLFGGISVGMLQHGMSFDDALKTFTLLTVGDGLVAQIPALLVCISAGFVVTRVSGSGANLGANILGELFGSNKVVVIAAMLILMLGFLPGFPLPVFAILSAALAGTYIFKNRRRANPTADNKGQQAHGSADGTKSGVSGKQLPTETLPIAILMNSTHHAAWEKTLPERLRDAFYVRFGMNLPTIVTRPYQPARDHEVMVLVNEIQAGVGLALPGHVRVLGDADEWNQLGICVVTLDRDGKEQAWIPAERTDVIESLGLASRSEFDEITRTVTGAVLGNIGELFGIQEAKNILDQMDAKFPELLKEVYRHNPVQRVAEVLQRLLREEVSIRNMKIILETLAQWGQREKDVILLVEHVRSALNRYISDRFAINGSISAMTLATDLEETFRSGVRQSQGSAFLNLDPARSAEISDRIAVHVESHSSRHNRVVLLVATDIRRFVKRFIENRLPFTHVISFSEISDAVHINVLRTL